MNEIAIPTFGPSLFGAELHINNLDLSYYNYGDTLVVDIETDEKNNFVGMAFTTDGKRVDYISYGLLDPVIADGLMLGKLVGHNLKGDMKWLVQWGVNLKPEQLHYDTCLASYVENTTKESHGLKDLAKEYLGMSWPTYQEMVGKGKNKQTLDKQEVGRVASYCGMDCLATYRLWKYFEKKLNPQQKRYLETIELPTARVLLEMELKGVKIDVPYLTLLDQKFGEDLDILTCKLNEQWDTLQIPNTIFNVNSNRQVAQLLEAQGAVLPVTQKGNKQVNKQVLEKWTHLPAVPLLLEYSKYEKLKTTYTEALLEKQKDGRIYCNFNQIATGNQGETYGIRTGRLSSSNPNLQNIPTRTEEGKSLRKAFIADQQKVFVDSDFSQIEPRLVAHFSKDPLFIRTFKEGRDIYQELVEGTGRDRQDGKTFMLALLYGAQPKKLANVFKCSEAEAEQIINRIMRKLPGVKAWIERTKYEARQKKGVWTLFKRWIPLPKINDDNKYERLHWERVAVNSVIQGSAAEIMKMGLIKLRELGYIPNLTVHDEYLIEVREKDFTEPICPMHHLIISHALENIIKLDVPIKVEVGLGQNWGEAKS